MATHARRGLVQDRARVAGEQKHETAYEAKKVCWHPAAGGVSDVETEGSMQ